MAGASLLYEADLCGSYGYRRTVRSFSGRPARLGASAESNRGVVNAGARLYRAAEEQRSRLAARREAALAAQRAHEEAATPAHKVVRKSDARRTVARLHDAALRERRKVSADRERARLALEALREGAWESTFRPRVSPASTELAAYQRDDRPIEERLHADGARARRSRELAAQNEARQRARDATPRITTRAASLGTRGDVSRRLHVEATFLAAKKREYSARTPGSPKIISPARAEARCTSLYRDAKRRDEALRRARDRDHRERAAQAQVMVLERSRQLAAKHDATPAERLTGQDAKARSQLLAQIVAAHDDADRERRQQQKLAALERRKSRRHDDLFDDAKRVADRRKARHLQAALKELDGCTFHPDLPAAAHHVQGDVHSRTRDWLRNREQKIQRLVLEKEAAEIDGCTFAPAVEPPPKDLFVLQRPPTFFCDHLPEPPSHSHFHAALDHAYALDDPAPPSPPRHHPPHVSTPAA